MKTPSKNGRRLRAAPAGFTLVEVMVSMAVLTIGMLGMANMQIVAVKQNQFAANMGRASGLGQDLVESISMWKYNDPRLQSLATVTSLSDDKIVKRMDLARAEDISGDSERIMQFGEKDGDPSASTAGALGTVMAAAASTVGDGQFRRYWNVFAWDPDGDGLPNAKFVLVVVRWKEPNVGMRQIYTTVVKANEAVYSL